MELVWTWQREAGWWCWSLRKCEGEAGLEPERCARPGCSLESLVLQERSLLKLSQHGGAGSHMYLEFGGNGPMQEGELQHTGNVAGRLLEVRRRGQASHQRWGVRRRDRIQVSTWQCAERRATFSDTWKWELTKFGNYTADQSRDVQRWGRKQEPCHTLLWKCCSWGWKSVWCQRLRSFCSSPSGSLASAPIPCASSHDSPLGKVLWAFSHTQVCVHILPIQTAESYFEKFATKVQSERGRSDNMRRGVKTVMEKPTDTADLS